MTDPWESPGQDPWGNWHGTGHQTPAPAKRYEKLADQLKTDLHETLQKQWADKHSQDQSSQDAQRLCRLESDIVEMKAHQSQFHNWFQETGTRLAKQDEQLTHLHAAVQQNQTDLQTVRTEVHTSADSLHQAMQLSLGNIKGDITAEVTSAVTSQMDRLEALLSKRQRND